MDAFISKVMEPVLHFLNLQQQLRFFAYWLIVVLESFSKITEIDQIFGHVFSTVKVTYVPI
jgi:hypothetical protein